MIIGIVGSRRRNSREDLLLLMDKLQELHKQDKITKIVTGDCDEGGDKFAREIAEAERGDVELEVKYKRDPETNEIIPDYIPFDFYDYYAFCKICYNRNEEIAKEPLDYLIALVAHDRKGGTENTIRHFRRLHKDWKEKLIIL